MKDTFFKGQKNNKYYRNILNKNYSIAAYAPFAKHTRILHQNKFSCLYFPGLHPTTRGQMLNQQRPFNINRIRAINRIGPHNLNLYSTLNISQEIKDLKLENNFITGRLCPTDVFISVKQISTLNNHLSLAEATSNKAMVV